MQQPTGGGDESGRAKGGSQHTITEADIEEEQALASEAPSLKAPTPPAPPSATRTHRRRRAARPIAPAGEDRVLRGRFQRDQGGHRRGRRQRGHPEVHHAGGDPQKPASHVSDLPPDPQMLVPPRVCLGSGRRRSAACCVSKEQRARGMTPAALTCAVTRSPPSPVAQDPRVADKDRWPHPAEDVRAGASRLIAASLLLHPHQRKPMLRRHGAKDLPTFFLCSCPLQERVQRLKYSVSADEQSAESTPHADRKYERQRLKYERLTKVRLSQLVSPHSSPALDSAPLLRLWGLSSLSTIRHDARAGPRLCQGGHPAPLGAAGGRQARRASPGASMPRRAHATPRAQRFDVHCATQTCASLRRCSPTTTWSRSCSSASSASASCSRPSARRRRRSSATWVRLRCRCGCGCVWVPGKGCRPTKGAGQCADWGVRIGMRRQPSAHSRCGPCVLAAQRWAAARAPGRQQLSCQGHGGRRRGSVRGGVRGGALAPFPARG